MKKDIIKTSIPTNVLIWFGAAIGIGEIITGTYAAGLGLIQGSLAILIGHIIGCLFLFGAAYIGAKTNKNAMDSVKNSFGNKGNVFFASLNVLQLLGWTAAMLIIGAAPIAEVVGDTNSFIWILFLAVIILFWSLITSHHFKYVNYIAVTALLLVIAYMTYIAISQLWSTGLDGVLLASDDSPSFGSIVELSVAMPLSWVPLIADYISKSEKPVKSSIASTVAYFFASTWMYLLGLICALAMVTQEGSEGVDIFRLLGSSAVIVFAITISTVTTAFLDVNSASESLISAFGERHIHRHKIFITIIVVLGAAIAIIVGDNFMTSYESFLYLIGACFAPMIGIMLIDFFVLKRSFLDRKFMLSNFIVWAIGFAIYETAIQLGFETVIGTTVPCVIITSVIAVLVGKLDIKVSK